MTSLRRICRLKVIEGKIEETRIRGRRRKQLLDYLKGGKNVLRFESRSIGSLSGELAVEDAMDLSQES